MAAGLGRTSGEGSEEDGFRLELTGFQQIHAFTASSLLLGFDLRSGSFTPFVERWDPSVNWDKWLWGGDAVLWGGLIRFVLTVAVLTSHRWNASSRDIPPAPDISLPRGECGVCVLHTSS